MRPPRKASWRHALAIAVLGTLALPSVADAHPRLKRSSPSVGERLHATPAFLRFWFSEVPELKLTSLTLVDSAGHAIALGTVQRDPGDKIGVFAAILAPLAPGAYTAKWKTAAADGHPTDGIVTFTVVPAGAAPVSAPDSGARTNMNPDSGLTAVTKLGDAGTPLEISYVVARALSFASLLVVIGAVIFQFAVLPRALADADLSARVARAVAGVGGGAAAVLALAAFGKLALQVQVLNLFDPSQATSVGVLVGSTRWGVAWMVQVGGALLAWTAFRAARRNPSWWSAAAVMALVLSTSPALAGHAGSAPRLTALAVAADTGHILGASGWMGSLFVMTVIAIPLIVSVGGKDRWLNIASLVNAFSPTALAFATLLALTGLFAAWLHLGSVGAVLTSGYGRTLLLKLIVLVPLAATGAYNWRRVRPVLGTTEATSLLRKTAIAELSIAVAVICVTAALVATEPPMP